MQALGIDVMPIFCGDIVAERIFIVSERRYLRIAAGAGGKEHEHRCRRLPGGCPRPDVRRRCCDSIGYLVIEIMPARACPAPTSILTMPGQIPALCDRQIQPVVQRSAVGGAEDCADARRSQNGR